MGQDLILLRCIPTQCILWYIVIFNIVHWKCKNRAEIHVVGHNLGGLKTSHLIITDNSADKFSQNNLTQNFPFTLFERYWQLSEHTHVAAITSKWKWHLSALLQLNWTHWNWKHENKVPTCSFVSLTSRGGYWQGLHDAISITIHNWKSMQYITKIKYCDILPYWFFKHIPTRLAVLMASAISKQWKGLIASPVHNTEDDRGLKGGRTIRENYNLVCLPWSIKVSSHKTSSRCAPSCAFLRPQHIVNTALCTTQRYFLSVVFNLILTWAFCSFK